MNAILRRLLKNVNLLNLALLAAAIGLWLGMGSPPAKQSYPSSPASPPAKERKGPSPSHANPPMADFVVVADSNLFHPERRIPPEKKDDAAQVRPDLVLYGTMFNGEMSVAFIEDRKSPRTTPGRGPRQITAKKGDLFNGFAITSIEADRIRLARGGETMIVPLTDPGKRRAGGAGQTLSPTPASNQPARGPITAAARPVVEQPSRPVAPALQQPAAARPAPSVSRQPSAAASQTPSMQRPAASAGRQTQPISAGK